MKEVHLLISGVVQGVGFRWTVNRAAHRLDLTGRVSNLDNGSVEVIAQGTQGGLEQLIAELKVGPGRVDEVAVTWTKPKTTYTTFEIR